MKILYVGQYSKGSTSRMRGEEIKLLLRPTVFKVINEHIPFYKTNRVWRSIGFRLKEGPLVRNINQFIINSIGDEYFDLIWVDKAVFVHYETIALLRAKGKKLVHFTPDMAFYTNRSKNFFKAIKLFDFVITTKTKEVQCYLEYVSEEKLLVTTQGFSKNIHKPYFPFDQKDNSVVFIGLAEPSRYKIVSRLLEAGISVVLIGKGWNNFVLKHKKNKNFYFLGEAVFGEKYSKIISSSKFSLGLLSKAFPELHTTRTFEIPACGTALLTERNEETSSFFEEEEAIFYSSPEELIKKIKYYSSMDMELEKIINKGNKKVFEGGFENSVILAKLLKQILE